MAISLAIIALAVVATVAAIALAARAVAQRLDQLEPGLAELRTELLPALRSMRQIVGRGEDVAEKFRYEADAAIATARRIRGRVEAATRRAEERLGDLDALYEVVYDEVADTALGLATAFRTTRSVAGHARSVLGRRRRRKKWFA
jgi:hypothetical protein